MGHVYINVNVKGRKAERKLEKILVDTGATYMVMPINVIKEMGEIKNPYSISVELGDGRKVKADIYIANIEINGREGPTLILTFKDAKTVIGVQALEALGLKVDTETGKLEPTRPNGIAYLYLDLNDD